MPRRLRKHSRSNRVYAEAEASHPSHPHPHRKISQSQSQSQSKPVKESHETLKRELLRIHHRNRKASPRRQRRRRRSRRIANVVPSNSMKDEDAALSLYRDYSSLSKNFKALSKYHVNARRKQCPTCVKCRKKRPKKVMFPCEHLCLCSACSVPMPKQCPLCKCPVQVVLQNADNVIDNYWLWVDEVESPLTATFIGCFRVKSYDAINAAIATAEQRKQTENIELDVDDEKLFQKRRTSWMRHFLCPFTSCSYVRVRARPRASS